MELKRDIYEKLIEWKKQDSGKVLELNGVRQVEKTFILDKFARENYKRYFYINMIQTSRKEFVECYHAATSWKPGEKRIERPLQKTFELFDETFADDKNTITQRKKMEIRLIEDYNDKQKIARRILEALPDWFGIEEARENYIKESTDQLFFAALEKEQTTGFLCLKETSKDTLELSVMGVLKEYQRRGIGKELFLNAKKLALEKGYSFLQVKTVQMGYYEVYDNTNRFYLNLGFKEFEVFPTLWDEWNPCQIYVMSLW